MTFVFRRPLLSIACIAASLISACGGGSSQVSPTVTGTAATGAAIASGTVTLKCVAGSSNVVTTNADGSYSIDVSSVTFPCVGRVDYKDSTGTARKLHTFVRAAGIANITPLTELLMASLTSSAATNAFDSFDGVAVKGFTAAQIKAAADAVKLYLQTVLGVDISNLGDDPIGTRFAARTGTSDGDKLDKILDDLKAKLVTSGKQLADAEADVSRGASTSSTVGCTGKVAAFFSKNSGRYATTAHIYTPAPTGPSTVAGLADGAATTVVVKNDCTVTIGSHVLTYKDASYSESPGTGADVGKFQVNVEITGAGFVTFSSYEVFTSQGSLVSLGDTATGAFANFFLGDPI
jgi:hypothetical protein